MIEEFATRLRQALAGELPGEKAHSRMMSYQRPDVSEAMKTVKNVRYGSVLVLLYIHKNEIYTSLMLRPAYNGVHSAQISFPGGSQETGETPKEAALRESHEELNIDPKGVKIIGRLSQVFIPPSRFLVTPFVGYTKQRPDFIPDPIEVDQLIEVPLLRLFDDAIESQQKIELPNRGVNILVPCFALDDFVVWGATAMMISELKHIYQELEK